MLQRNEPMEHTKAKFEQPGMLLTYHQGYEPIYNANYEFGFVFIDEDEVDDEDSTEFYDDNGDTLTIH